MTIGADFAVKKLKIDGMLVSLRIWDFGGEERYRLLLPSYATDADGGIFMYDITRYSSFQGLDDWLLMFKQGSNFDESKIPVIMVGGKADLEEKRAVKIEDAAIMANKRDLSGYYECSSKTGENIEKIFEIIARDMMRNAGLI